MNFWIVILLLFTFPGYAGAEDAVNFVVEGESFIARQQNVHEAGFFTEELSESEMLRIFQERRYEFSTEYSLKYKQYSYWVLFVENRNPTPTRIFLSFPLMALKSKAWLYSGETLKPFARYPVVHDMFYTEIPPGRSAILGMRLSGGNITGPAKVFKIYDFESAAAMVTSEQHVMGSLAGAVAIMVLYNLGMYIFFRRIYFLYYTVYSTAGMYSLAVFVGYLPWNLPHVAVGLTIAGLGLLLFSNSSLSLRSSQPRLYKISLGLMVYSVLFGAYLIIQKEFMAIVISIPLALLFCVYASVRCARAGFRPAIYLVIGWAGLMLATVVNLLDASFFGYGLLSHASTYGFAWEVCFFSFAIGQKVRLSEQKALRESEHAFNQLKKVFYPHQIEQIKSGIELERTMPTGKGAAAVISFDIIESSKIQQPRAKTFIENSIKSCVSIINENYDPTQLRANGYRIKEVGDGFLCSVGYPFKLPPGMVAAQCAVELSLRFIQIFQNQVNQLLEHAPVYCSIGIAFDTLEGYFPQVGTIEYDVYGRAVILATRYESFRRQLYPNGVPGHILTLHEKVYEQLPASLQATFQEVDLHRAHMVVRDDLYACKIYFRVIQPAEILEVTQAAS
ncbi:7TM diverse intracellular signaling domain-containing protein [Oligoflexus tunisiensis]|uniref:7TM diverse intracellular signaling domain-containing protein n=1 Tax=Oligoflexus tunisiensis TaxID=708132 RepID=UPI00159EF741|nr:7TM diverse intracellular signaling domain-containing protein [Oligoflexus tunisiensis]